MKVQRKTIAVIFGGCSTEYEVSLQSAYSVIKSIDREKYRIVLIGIERRTGRWLWFQGGPDKIREDRWHEDEACKQVYPSMDKEVRGLLYLEENESRILSLDAALPILHGKNGEDGTVQGVFELMGVPVIGCGVLSSRFAWTRSWLTALWRQRELKRQNL